jgi:hypothetical protein
VPDRRLRGWRIKLTCNCEFVLPGPIDIMNPVICGTNDRHGMVSILKAERLDR